ncbi:response regulator [Undibacterium arcticum]
MDAPLNLLIIEDTLADFLLVERHLRKDGLDAHCRQVANSADLVADLTDMNWDAVLSDYNVPGMEFTESLALVRSVLPDVPVILVSGTVGEEKRGRTAQAGRNGFPTQGKSDPPGASHQASTARRSGTARQARGRASAA